MSPSKNWEASRKHYEELDAAKKRLQAALENYKSEYMKVADAFLKNTETYATALRSVHITGTSDDLDMSFCHLVEQSLSHRDALSELFGASDAFFEIQREYTFESLQRLKNDHGMIHAQLADAFGMHNASLARWLGSTKAQRKGMCEEE
jgi:hypothetical protein